MKKRVRFFNFFISRVHVLSIFLFVCAVIFILLAWNDWKLKNRIEHSHEISMTLFTNMKSILHLDEVLTMSARMYAATGDSAYEKRYKEFEPALDKLIKETLNLYPSPSAKDKIKKTDTANLRLVEMEYQSFSLVEKGKRPEALRLLSSEEYVKQKNIYAQGIQEAFRELIFENNKHAEREWFCYLFFLGEGIFGFILISLAWIFSILTTRQWMDERKIAEDAILMKTTLLEAQSETSIDGILAVDDDGKTIFFNQHFREMWNIPPEVLETQDDEKMVQHVLSQLKDPVGFVERVKYLYAHKDKKSHDEIPFKDGKTFERYSSSLIDRNGYYHGRIWYFRDVTERKKMENELIESKERFRNLIEATSDFVWEVDENALYTYASPKIRDILGYEPDEILGKTPFSFMPPEEAQRVAGIFGPIVSQQKSFSTLENANLHKNGHRVILETSGVPIFDKNGQFKGYRGIDRDISHRKAEEREKEGLRKKLLQSEKMSALGQLASGVAHEINNPLTVIFGFAQGALNKIGTNDFFYLPFKSIERESQRCRNLVQDLLTFSRINESEKALCDINTVIDGALSLISSDTKFKMIELVKDLPEHLPKIIINPNKIQQVVINLCNNAIDAMPKGGTLTVRTKLSEKKGQKYLEIEIQDSGEGIPKEIRHKIFEPFFTTKEVGKGTGLGLSLAYEIIEQHQGMIEFKSEVGKGTIFHAFLPIHKDGVA